MQTKHRCQLRRNCGKETQLFSSQSIRTGFGLFIQVISLFLTAAAVAHAQSEVLNWSADQLSPSTTVIDTSGAGNNGTLVDTGFSSYAKVGYSLIFNGGTSYARTPNVSGLATGNTAHSISAWVNVYQLPAKRAWILSLGNAGSGAHHWLIDSTGHTQFGAWNGPTLSPSIPLNQWTHIAMTYANGTLTAYVNGSSIGSRTATTFNLQGLPLSLAQAQVAGENNFYGYLDEVRVYNYALSASEVAALATNTIAPFVAQILPTSGPVGTSIGVFGAQFNSSAASLAINGTSAQVGTIQSGDGLIFSNIPAGATSGPVIVGANSLTSNTNVNFTVTPPPCVTYTTTTLAGAVGIYGDVDGAAGTARFYFPNSVAVGLDGSVYVAEAQAIRKISPLGTVSTIAGLAGDVESVDGTATNARFTDARALSLDAAGNLFVLDSTSVRVISPAGVVTTIAGSLTVAGYQNGTGSNARFKNPRGMVIDSAGNLYVADNVTLIRKITPAGVVTTVTLTTATGDASTPPLSGVTAMAIDKAGNLFIVDDAHEAIRKINPSGGVSTIAGGLINGYRIGSNDGPVASASFSSAEGLALDDQENLYFTDSINDTVRTISASGQISTIAGTAQVAGAADGPGVGSRFNFTSGDSGVAVDRAGAVYIADTLNQTIRKLTPHGSCATTSVGFSPGSASVGSSVTIFGDGFSSTPANNVVRINGVAASVVGASANQLTVYIPTGATSGIVSVSVNGGPASVSTSSLTVVPNSSFLYWPLDQASGYSIPDASGYGNVGSLYNGGTWTTGKVGSGSLRFDGISANAVSYFNSGIFYGTGDAAHSMAAWVKVNALPSGRAWIAVLGYAAAGAHHWLLNSNGSTSFGEWNGPTLSPSLPLGQWAHVVMTYANGTLSAYLNGALIGSKPATFNLQGQKFTASKPGIATEKYFNGQLDEVHLYNYALTPTQVSNLYNTGAP